MTAGPPPLLYSTLASWWPLLSSPADYAEESAVYAGLLAERGAPATVLELGSGGGNNASHLKARFALTLVDVAPGMLEVSRALNPGCEHVIGDMRTARLGREFDAVFVHDAVAYMTSEADLRCAMETAFIHCRPGGVALFVPDYVRETFAPGTDHGGHDGPARGLRYLEWTWDPNPADGTYVCDFAFLLRAEDGSVIVERDRHTCGLFSTADWLRLLASVGFTPEVRRVSLGEGAPPETTVFVAIKPR